MASAIALKLWGIDMSQGQVVSQSAGGWLVLCGFVVFIFIFAVVDGSGNDRNLRVVSVILRRGNSSLRICCTFLYILNNRGGIAEPAVYLDLS
jgi:hypothetical protein